MKKRMSNIEILRIISMFLIVMSHYALHGNSSNIFINKIILNIFYLGNLGVTIFAIITGYVMYNSEYKMEKILNIITTTFFYSFVIYVIYNIILKNNFNIFELIKSMFPIAFGKYWYITYYCIMYMMIPYMNIIIQKFDYKEYTKFLLIFFCILYLIPSFTNYFYELSKLVYLTYGYFLGAYLHKYNPQVDIKILRVSGFCISVFILISIFFFNFINKNNLALYFLGISKFTILLLAIIIVLIFLKKDFYSDIINKIASYTLAVYIISDNEYLRTIIWKNVFALRDINSVLVFIIYSFTSIIIVYVVSMIIEIIRTKTIKKYLNCIFKAFYLRIFQIIKKLLPSKLNLNTERKEL